MTPQEFAAKIKTKYPSYANMDDIELSQKIVAKYPQYKSQVKFEEAPITTQPSYGEEVGAEQLAGAKKAATSFQTGAENIAKGMEKGGMAGVPDVLKGIVGGTAGVITGAGQAVLAPITPALSKILSPVAEKAIPVLREQNPEIAKIFDTVAPKIADWAEKNPENATIAGDVINSILLLAGGKGATEPIKKALTKKGITAAKESFAAMPGEIGEMVVKTTGKAKAGIESFASATKNKFETTLPDKTAMRSTFTNLPEEIYKRVEDPIYAQKVKGNMEILESGNKNPYYNLASNIAEKTNKVVEDAKKLFRDSAIKEVGTKKTYDIGARLKEIVDSVSEFKVGKDIKFDVTRNKAGQITGYKLTKGRYSPYTTNEINNLNSLIDDIMSARNINADELIALDQKFGSYYNSIPQTSAGPTPYHAAVMQLKNATEGRISSMLSPEMKSAYDAYTRMSNLRSDIANKIVDASGELKPGAEQFLANITNKNKGEVQRLANEYKDILGIDIVSESQAINDALKFMLTQAPTGGRIHDILMSYGFGTVGAGLGALVGQPVAGTAAGIMVGKRLTSPKVVGTRAIEESLLKAK